MTGGAFTAGVELLRGAMPPVCGLIKGNSPGVCGRWGGCVKLADVAVGVGNMFLHRPKGRGELLFQRPAVLCSIPRSSIDFTILFLFFIDGRLIGLHYEVDRVA